jgi:hypothetical protein
MRWIYSSNNTKLYLLLAVNEYGCTYAPLFNDIDNPEGSNANGYMPYIYSSVYEDISQNISLSANQHGLGRFFDDRTNDYCISGFGFNNISQIGGGAETTIYCEPAGFGMNNPQGKLAILHPNDYALRPLAKFDISILFLNENIQLP